jgi:photosystem I subunit 11
MSTKATTGLKTFSARKAAFVRPTRSLVIKAASEPKASAIQPINGDPFVGMLETPVTSNPEVVNFLSNLPAYRTGVAPLLRGVEVGLAHGFFLPGPFIKLGPLRNVDGAAEIAGCLSAAGLVLILALALSVYGSAQFQESPKLGVKTLSGRSVQRDPLQSAEGWNDFTAGFTVGALSGVAWAYACTQFLPYYS